MRKLIYLSAILLVLTACKKDPIQYTFDGKITESVGGNGLSGVSVSIYQIPFSSSVTSNNYVLAGSTTTDSEGNYSITFDREKVTEFKINLDYDGYYKRDINLNSGEISSENNNTTNYEMDPKSWIKFNINNEFPADQNDELNILLLNYREGCQDCATSDYYAYEGIVDTSVVFGSTGAQYFNFTYIYVGNTSWSDSVYMTPFDTVNYAINY
ncbi:MAG: hypothetical protein ABJG68_09205 [Crocinitomicaceae bacterium]